MSSNRVKRLLKKIENLKGNLNKKRRISGSDPEYNKAGSNLWTPKALGDIPTSNIYNSTSRSPPAELFRKDLISAMKLPDNEPLTPEEYWLILDTWKQEWEKGVQVPVNPEVLPESSVRIIQKKDKSINFKLPRKYIRITHDEFFSNDLHQMTNAVTQAEKICRYDLDELDFHWLNGANQRRQVFGLSQIEEDAMELVVEELENQCFENMQEAINSEACLGIEYDEDVICDVCRSPDSEEGNEMVFCDSCDICVHQACYGITEIPEGSWLCRTCSLAVKPNCILCPNKGGAMKCTRSGQKWAHVSCALWIPEVSIGCVEKMEPITKIAHIPPSRWSLICCLCRDRIGACIQCSVKSCKTAYHVTCGFQNGLEMKAVVEDENDEDGVKLRSYCPKHSKNKPATSDSDDDDEEGGEDAGVPTNSKENAEEKASDRAKRLQQIEAEFFKYVKLEEIADNMKVPLDIVELIYQYWKLKRRSGFNKPLLMPHIGENDALGQEQEDTLYARMKMFVHLRQDLERVRNLCYMVSRREKLSRTWYHLREKIFEKQTVLLSDAAISLSDSERHSVIHACHGSSIYDRLYSYNSNCCVKNIGISTLQTSNGEESKSSVESVQQCDNSKGQRKPRTIGERLPNPYAKMYNFNGVHNRSQRRLIHQPRKVDNSSTKGNIEEKSCTLQKEKCLKNCDAEESLGTFLKDEEEDAKNMCDETVKSPKVEIESFDRSPDFPNKELSVQQAGVSVEDVSTVIKSEQQSISRTEGALQICNTSSIQNTAPADLQLPSGADSFVTAITTAGECMDCRENSTKTYLRNGCHQSKIDKKELCRERSVVDDTRGDMGRDISSKENVERLIIDGMSSQSKSFEKKSEDEKLDNSGLHWHKHKKTSLMLKKQSLLKSSPEKGAIKDRLKKISPVCESTPFRDKLRQESAKLHATLFSNSVKGSLNGYRIPKKSRESEGDSKSEEQHSPQQSGVWKDCRSPANVSSLPHSPTWNSNVASSSAALLPTPPNTVISPERRITRRDRQGDGALPHAMQVSGKDNGCSPRLVIKLRKDPNYPESPRWRRDGDVSDSSAYEFKCEQTESPAKHIRLKFNAKFDRQRYKQSPYPSVSPPSHCIMTDIQSPTKCSKYSMRARVNLENSVVQNLNSSYS